MANEVRVDVVIDDAQAVRDAEGMKGKLGKTFSDMGKIAGGFFIAQIGAAIADKGIETLKSSISLAMSLNEIQSKSNTIFGESAAAINKWAASASTGFGQSKAQALDAASTFGNMFVQLGSSTENAAAMSKVMTELASDFASFHNADITEVINAQTAAFRGEYDALQRFVPTINAAAVETEALNQTGKESAKQLTAQEKALATYTLMMRGAGDATGDFDRTSGSLTNQQRILSAQWKDLQADIGQAVIPALTAMVTTINTQVVPAVRDFAQDVKRYWESDIKPAIENLQAAWERIDGIVVPILENIIGMYKLFAKEFALAAGIIIDLISGDFSGAWEKVKTMVTEAVDEAKRQLGNFKDALSEALPLLGEAAKAIGKAIFDGIWEGLGDLWQLGADIIDWVVQGLKAMAWMLIDEAKRIAGEVASALNPKNLIGGAIGGLGGAIGGIGMPLEGVMSGGGGGGAPLNYIPVDYAQNAFAASMGRGPLANRGRASKTEIHFHGPVNVRDESEARLESGNLAHYLAAAGVA